jgi:hypothetical protein
MRRPAARAAMLCAAFTLGALTPSTGGAETQHGARVVRCRVESQGEVKVSGRCRFTTEVGGSSAIANVNPNESLFGEISMISVTIVATDEAEVRGLTRSGVISRRGEARRSTRERACWDGDDFRICAR